MKNRIQFNAEKTPAGTQLITRDGRNVSEWFYFRNLDKEDVFPVTAVIDGFKEHFTKEGRYYNHNSVSVFDLFIKPNVKEIWVNLYKSIDDKVIYTGQDFNTEAEALKHKGSAGYVKTIRITDEI